MHFPALCCVKRKPARDVRIAEIREDGERVAVLCTVISFDHKKGEGQVDDGTGMAKIILDDFLFADKIREGRLVRLIGRAYKSDEGVIIRAEIVHDMEGVDPSLYARVRELERRVWHESGL